MIICVFRALASQNPPAENSRPKCFVINQVTDARSVVFRDRAEWSSFCLEIITENPSIAEPLILSSIEDDPLSSIEASVSPPITSGAERRERLKKLVDYAGELLPISGPISAFVFLNPLQALEDQPFDKGLLKGASLFGCEPYLSEDHYRREMVRGRIRKEDLQAALKAELGPLADRPACSLGTKYDLRMAMIEYPLRSGPAEELKWFVAETDALTRMRSEVTASVRERFINETKHWLMRDLRVDKGTPRDRSSHLGDSRSQVLLADLLLQFRDTNVENWTEARWESFSLQALWRVCRAGANDIDLPVAPPPLPIRHRDLLMEAAGVDSDALVHDVMIRYCAAFADQGMAHWNLPFREEGFYKAFCEYYRQAGGPPDAWLRGFDRELSRIHSAGLSPMDSLEESLQLLGVSESEWPEFISASMLALRGWASMILQNEVRGDRVPIPAPPGTLLEFLAVRLILERQALSYLARQTWKYTGPLSELRTLTKERLFSPERRPIADQRAFMVFQIAQILGWSPLALQRMPKLEWVSLVREIEEFSSLQRRRLYHLAFERRFRVQALDALSLHGSRKPLRVPKPRFQAVFCIDTREESFRRHLEEIDPDVETFSAAGFFCVPIYYKGVADAHYAALCPIVIRPKYWVNENVVYSLEDENRRRAKARHRLGTAAHQVQMGSRSVALGSILAPAFGVLASIPLVARVLFPRLTAQIRNFAGQLVQAPSVTRLTMDRTESEPSAEEGHLGFTVEEMANTGERVLRDIGLTTNFARLVMFFGHGSACLNNPHKSAYDCGACSGSAGSPNARALAAMLNDPRVRKILPERGLIIPPDTYFLGGLHNTAEDSISFLDLDLLPQSHLQELRTAEEILEKTCERNAHERCRRFYSAPLDITFPAALRHVEGRAEDLAQTRPEYGNASNAMCFVGRRARVRGLYLDRRSFMHSYDPTTDDEKNSILGRILAPVIPVCEGINLQYFFAALDPAGWACGTKLPHNVTSLLGVMDGAASDLRLGLPWQGVEIHEPVRLLFVLETTPEAITMIMDRDPLVSRILRNGWAQLAVLDPNSERIQVFHDGKFEDYVPEAHELPHAESSVGWYRNWRDHLGFAQIRSRTV